MTAFPFTKPRRNETAEVVRPILQYLAIKGFVIVTDKIGFVEAAMILQQRPCKGVIWRVNTGRAMLPGAGGKIRPVKFGNKGTADICGILKGGRFIGLECKLPGGKPDTDQRAFANVIQAMGGIAITATSPEEAWSELVKAGVK